VSSLADAQELRDSIRKRAELIPTCRGDAKRKEIKLAQGELEEAEEIVKRTRTPTKPSKFGQTSVF
jgi:hypothetical protein